MSLIAFDLGNCNILATVPRGKGIDVVTSDTSSKQIPSCVSYTSERRFFADAASSQKITNRTACYYYLPLICGEKYDSEAVKRAFDAGAQFTLKASEQDGRALAPVFFGEDNIAIETEQLAAAMFCQVKKYAESMDSVMPYDFLLTVPGYWSTEKKMKMKAAAQSTGLNCLGIVTQHSAVGIGYYMRRVQEFQAMDADNKGITVGFLSIGEIESYCVVIQMNKSGITTLNQAHSMQVGSIDFDKVLASMIVDAALLKTKQITRDELLSKKSQIKIMKAANQAKKTLSINQNAPVTLECIGDNQIDIPVMLNLNDFEAKCKELGIIDKITQLITEGLGETKPQDLEAFECIGGASRVKAIQNQVSSIFGDKVTKRLNADEAPAFGLGWVGALRSSKHRIPFDLKISDKICNLKAPITFQVYNRETNEKVFDSPFTMFENGENYPKSKKITLRFKPGQYRSVLTEGDIMHEEQFFTINEKNLTQFTDTEFATANGVDFNDLTIQVKARILADDDCNYKLAQLQRNDQDLVLDDIKKKVKNEKYDEQQEQYKTKVAKIEEDFTTANAAYEPLQKAYEIEKSTAEAAKTELPKAPAKPVRATMPTPPSENVEVTEKVPRIASFLRDIILAGQFQISNTTSLVKEILKFEAHCKQIDRNSLRFDAAVNNLESQIYSTREAFDYGNLNEFVTEEELTQINAWLDAEHAFAQNIEGKHQLTIIEEKAAELEGKLKIFFDRKNCHCQTEEKLYGLRSEIKLLCEKFSHEKCAQIHAQLNATIQEVEARIAVVNKKAEIPDCFEGVNSTVQKFEEEMRKIQKEIDAEIKAEEEKAKKAKDEEEKAQKEAEASAKKEVVEEKK
ncbi:Hsp88-like protein [Spironucleus salmonicida]|uniref:Hsp88-like protein n=1 Tax=Spironucleus salmonicida TaxID=348837 RepID=V6LTM7_9EUKA|nr:Hsp88-like protein [Spironucleus salmonicida]|eukprot:EST47603.1 Hsp88-like protein [Spironucleus salmonicida]